MPISASSQNNGRTSSGPGKVFAITSGKGGVGKTALSVNLSITLTKANLNVLLIDADMGLANVDLMTGVSSTHTIEDVLEQRASIFDALVEGPESLTILPASSGLGRFEEMAPDRAVWFRRELLKLQNAFDFIFIDTGAGISANVTDFAFMADEVIIVMTPEPTAFADAYAMAKLIFTERPDADVSVVVNMSKNDGVSEKLVGKFAEIIATFLKKSIIYHGCIQRDSAVTEAIMRQRPLALHAANAPAMQSIRKIARNILGIEKPKPRTLFNR